MRYQDSRIFVGNFAADKVPPSELEELFAQYGRLVEGPVIRRRFAFVQFDNPESAQRAIQEATGTVLGGLPIDCKLADDREPRYKTKSERLAGRGRGGRGRGRGDGPSGGSSWGAERGPYDRGGPPPPPTDYNRRPPPSYTPSYEADSYRRGPPSDAYGGGAYHDRDRSSRLSSHAPYSIDQARDRRMPPPHSGYGRPASPPRLAPGEAYTVHTGDPRNMPISSAPPAQVQCMVVFSSSYGEGIAKRARDMFAAERVEAEEKYVAAHMGVEHLVYEACTRNIRALLFVNESNPSLYALHIILPVEQAKTYCDVSFSEALYHIRGDHRPSPAPSSGPPSSSHYGGYPSHSYSSGSGGDPRLSNRPPPSDYNPSYSSHRPDRSSQMPPPRESPSASYGRNYPPPSSSPNVPYDPAPQGPSHAQSPPKAPVDPQQLANLLRILQSAPGGAGNTSYAPPHAPSSAPSSAPPSTESLQTLLGSLNRSATSSHPPPSGEPSRDPRAGQSSSTVDLVAKQLSLQRDAKPTHSDPRLR